MTKRYAVPLTVAFLLAGCGGGTPAPEPRSYDLGLDAPASALPAVRVGTVRAAAPFDSTDMQYRLAYRNAAEIAAFANTRWAATPGEMLRKQLQRAATRGDGKCTLSVEVQEFTQVFSSQTESSARIEARILLLPAGAVRQLAVTESGAGADAVSGASAFARAANRAIGELGEWIAAQPACR